MKYPEIEEMIDDEIQSAVESALADAEVKHEQEIIALKEAQTDISSTTVNVEATTINIKGTTVNIDGKLVINGQPYLDHAHTGNLGSPTSGVI